VRLFSAESRSGSVSHQHNASVDVYTGVCDYNSVQLLCSELSDHFLTLMNIVTPVRLMV